MTNSEVGTFLKIKKIMLDIQTHPEKWKVDRKLTDGTGQDLNALLDVMEDHELEDAYHILLKVFRERKFTPSEGGEWVPK